MKRLFLFTIAAISAALCFGQTTYEDLARRAVTAMEDDSLLVAEDLFKQALKAEPAAPGNAIIWGHLASIAERTGREREALEHYNIALGLAPSLPALLLGRASLNMKMGDESRALADYNEVLGSHPDHPEALLMRAYINQSRRLLKEAREDFEHILRLNPAHEQALLGLALVNDNDRRPQAAMELLERVIDLYPQHAAGYALKAGMELDRRQYERAEADYTKAIELDPNSATYRLARARLYTLTKKKRLAREDVRHAARLGASAEELAGAVGMKVKSTAPN